MTQLEELLSYLHETQGSDLHLKPGAVPHVRVDGQLKATPFEVPAPGVVEACASIAAGEQVRAMAFRLEQGPDLRWRCAAVELGSTPARHP